MQIAKIQQTRSGGRHSVALFPDVNSASTKVVLDLDDQGWLSLLSAAVAADLEIAFDNFNPPTEGGTQ